ncbi:MAG: excisionase family DNA-binding protein, partial [Gemmatimonadetes bacterium]|nr:excisionase family DNA-binding protein [Gemmatimonadota bacterium]
LGGVPVKTVNQYAREGRIPSLFIGKHRRFSRRAVEAAITAAAGSGRRL